MQWKAARDSIDDEKHCFRIVPYCIGWDGVVKHRNEFSEATIKVVQRHPDDSCAAFGHHRACCSGPA